MTTLFPSGYKPISCCTFSPPPLSIKKKKLSSWPGAMSESSPCQAKAKALASVHRTLLNDRVPQQNMTEVQRCWPQINKTPVFDHREKLELFLHTNLWPLKRLGEGKFSSFPNVNQTCFPVSAELAVLPFRSVFPESGKWESSRSATEHGGQCFPSSL